MILQFIETKETFQFLFLFDLLYKYQKVPKPVKFNEGCLLGKTINAFYIQCQSSSLNYVWQSVQQFMANILRKRGLQALVCVESISTGTYV